MMSKLSSFATCARLTMAIVLGLSQPAPSHATNDVNPEYQRFPYYWWGPNCPDGFDITSQEECSKAIASLGVTNGGQPWTGSSVNMPRFCSLQKNSDSTIFNTNPNGDKKRWDLAPVCKWTGDEAPPDFFRVSRENVTEWRGVEHTITVKPEEWDYFLAFQESRKNGFSCPCNPGGECNEIEAPGKHFHPPNPEKATFDCKIWIASWMHAEDQCIQGYFNHISKDGFSPRMRCEEIPGCRQRGEHQAGRHTTGLGALRGLQTSPGHCNSMFQTEFRGIGVAHGMRRNDPRGDGDIWTVLYNAGGNDITDSESCIPAGYTATGELKQSQPTIPPQLTPSTTPTSGLTSLSSSPPSTYPTFVSSGNVHVKYYEFIGQTSLPADGLKSLTPYADSYVKNIDFQPGSGAFATSGKEDNVAALFEGYLAFPLSDTYWICITSDEGSKVFIDGSLVINNDGIHDATQECAMYDTVVGVKQVQIEYFERDGDATLFLEFVPLSRPSWFRLMRVVNESEFVPKPNQLTEGPSLKPSDTPTISPTMITPTSLISSSPTSLVCPVSEFLGSSISFEAFNACWRAELTENGTLIGDFIYPECLTNNFSNGRVLSLFDGFDSTNTIIQFTNGDSSTNWFGQFTISRSADVTDIELGLSQVDSDTKKFALDLLSPSCLAPGSCFAKGFLGETFHATGFGACFEIQLFEGGILGMDSSDPGCSRKDSAGQQVISNFSGVDGRNVYFDDPNRWGGTFLLKESSDVTSPEIQNPNLDGNTREFLVDLFVPSCRN